MTKRSYRLKKGAYGEVRYQLRIQCYSRVGCDIDKETGKVLGVEWISF